MKNLGLLAVLLILIGCTDHESKKVTASADYDHYLITKVTPSKNAIEEEITFWQDRLDKDSLDIVSMNKLAGLRAALFGTTGEISNLYTAENLLRNAHSKSARGKDGYLRSLAHNYISQHRFKEAKVLLDSAYAFPDNKKDTEMMLFDVAMELGDYDSAKEYLDKIKNNSDYNYLIRLSKWSDYRGDLESAIRYMEKAKLIADSGGKKPLQVWTYSNLADFYGHAGRIQEAYQHYLKVLRLEPDNAYAKRGIAWIVFSSEGNVEDANRIIDSIMKNHLAPDYLLLKADIAEASGNTSEAEILKSKFIEAVTMGNYGDMYNTYLIELFAEGQPEKALELAQKEVSNRTTPETYSLLAYAQLKANMPQEALKTLQEKVIGKTYEPMAQYCEALVYEANGLIEKARSLKTELLEASFELGPIITEEIQKM